VEAADVRAPLLCISLLHPKKKKKKLLDVMAKRKAAAVSKADKTETKAAITPAKSPAKKAKSAGASVTIEACKS
jgi:hypothetical protein